MPLSTNARTDPRPPSAPPDLSPVHRFERVTREFRDEIRREIAEAEDRRAVAYEEMQIAQRDLDSLNQIERSINEWLKGPTGITTPEPAIDPTPAPVGPDLTADGPSKPEAEAGQGPAGGFRIAKVRVNYAEFAENVLRMAGRPMRLTEILDELVKMGLPQPDSPRARYMKIYNAMRNHPDRFRSMGNGRWTLVGRKS